MDGLNSFDVIRDRCAVVAERATFVRVDHSKIDSYARSLPLQQAIEPALDSKSHYTNSDDPAGTAAFVLTLDAINFGSGYFPRLKKRPGMSGYFTVASSLCDYFRTHGAMSAEQLSALTADDCRSIFEQDAADPVVGELMALFASALSDLGTLLNRDFAGSFTGLIESADHSALKLLGVLSRCRFYRDVERYEPLNLDVPFYKRAQLTSADLALAFGRIGLGRFDDLDQLTIFADNLVPHVLRIDGVLIYEDSLSTRIDREDLLTQGSVEEIELRAGAVHAVELIARSLKAEYPDVTVAGLDYVLWNRGQQRHYKTIKPRHRTRTVFY